MLTAFAHGYALLIGIGQTAYSTWSLPVTVKDAQAICVILTNPDLCAYLPDEKHIQFLHDTGATRDAIRNGLQWLKAQAETDPGSTIIIYYSGHGWLDKARQHYYLIPHDTNPSDVSGSALSAEAFTDALRQISSQRLLVILDCCHAEGMTTTKEAEITFELAPDFVSMPVPKALVEELKAGTGRAVFTSCRAGQKSWIRPDHEMSVYTYHLLEALQGAGNRPGDKDVRLSDLMNHLGKAVPESAHRMNRDQTPFLHAATEDWPIALLRGGKGLPTGGWKTIRSEARLLITQTIEKIDKGGAVIGIEAEHIVSGEVKQRAGVVAGTLTGLKLGEGKTKRDS